MGLVQSTYLHKGSNICHLSDKYVDWGNDINLFFIKYAEWGNNINLCSKGISNTSTIRNTDVAFPKYATPPQFWCEETSGLQGCLMFKWLMAWVSQSISNNRELSNARQINNKVIDSPRDICGIFTNFGSKCM